jgi:hypothetical protein
MSRLFDKRKDALSGTDRSHDHAVSSSFAGKKLVGDDDLAFHLDIPVDDAMRALDSRLSGLSQIEVAQAAKERGWAALHREIERHPVRAASPAALKSTGAKTAGRQGGLQPVLETRGHARSWRLALSGAGAFVVILAVVLGVWGAGLLGGEGVGPIAGSTSTVIADVTTTLVSDGTTLTSDSTVSSEPVATTQPPTSDTPPESGTPTTKAPDTTPTSGVTPTTGGTTPTTKPATPTTTNPVVDVSADKVHDAQVMAADLASAIIDYFLTDGSVANVARHVAPAAQPALTQLIGSLESPTSGQVVPGSAKTIDAHTVRFTLEFADSGGARRFFVFVDVSDQGALITAISAAS